MADKVIHEIRFIETDEGYRVEIKGDKERLKEMGCEYIAEKGFGPWMFFGRRRGRGKFWGHGRRYGPPPWDRETHEPAEERASEVH